MKQTVQIHQEKQWNKNIIFYKLCSCCDKLKYNVRKAIEGSINTYYVKMFMMSFNIFKITMMICTAMNKKLYFSQLYEQKTVAAKAFNHVVLHLIQPSFM